MTQWLATFWVGWSLMYCIHVLPIYASLLCLCTRYWVVSWITFIVDFLHFRRMICSIISIFQWELKEKLEIIQEIILRKWRKSTIKITQLTTQYLEQRQRSDAKIGIYNTWVIHPERGELLSHEEMVVFSDQCLNTNVISCERCEVTYQKCVYTLS